MKKVSISGTKAAEFTAPLGGIGTGCINMGADGRLVSFDIFEKPYLPDFSFFAVKAENGKELVAAKALGQNEWLEHLRCDSTAFAFPYAEVKYAEPSFPAEITLSAFNPFIPNNDTDSSIPAAFFDFEIKNTSENTLDYSLCAVAENPHKSGKNTFSGDIRTNMKCVSMTVCDKVGQEVNMCIATDAQDISYCEYIFAGSTSDSQKAEIFAKRFAGEKYLESKSYNDAPVSNSTGAIAAHITIAPSESKKIRFIISWFAHQLACDEDSNMQKSYYCRYFSSAQEVATYCFSYWDSFVQSTNILTETLYSSTIPEEVLEAFGKSLVIAKSETIRRNSDGILSPKDRADTRQLMRLGYILPYLFPKLERVQLENELILPEDKAKSLEALKELLKKPRRENRIHIDIILAKVLAVYRAYKLSGDIEWLREIFPYVTKTLDFVWSKFNPAGWDPDKSGKITFDPETAIKHKACADSAFMQNMYLEALYAAREMASTVKSRKKYREYNLVYQNGRNYSADDTASSEILNDKRSEQKEFIPFGYGYALPALIKSYGGDTTDGLELVNRTSGLVCDLSCNHIGFVPKLEYSDSSGTFICYFAVGGAQGFVEVGPDYIQMKLLQGSFKLKRFSLHKIPRKVYYGGRNIGFSVDGNTAVLEGNLPFNTEKDLTVIFDPR